VDTISPQAVGDVDAWIEGAGVYVEVIIVWQGPRQSMGVTGILGDVMISA